MPSLSIVIPAIHDSKLMEAGLVSVLQHRPADSEVLVVLDRPYDDPYDLSDEVRFIELSPRAGIVACIRAGIEASTAPLVHLVGCGWEVAEDWTEAAIQAFAEPSVAAVAPRVLHASQPERLRSVGVGYAAFGRLGPVRRIPRSKRHQNPVLGPELLSAFYRRDALAHVGGIPADLNEEAAAVEVALRLRAAGYRAALATESLVYAADTPASVGAFRRSADAERLFWRHLPANGSLAALLAHPWLIAVDVARSLPGPAVLAKIAGRLWGARAVWSMGDYRRRLQALEVIAADSAPATTLRLDAAEVTRHRRAA